MTFAISQKLFDPAFFVVKKFPISADGVTLGKKLFNDCDFVAVRTEAFEVKAITSVHELAVY